MPNTLHRYNVDTDRCVCGGEIIYFEYREDVAHYRRTGEHKVIAYDGYGCAVEGKAYHACCESTPHLGHAAGCAE